MTVGLAIPGVETVWPREAWQTKTQPITGPKANPSAWTMGAIHYPGADNIPDGDDWDIPVAQHLRNGQTYYLQSRGYSYGYNWVVDWLGGVWECRGWDIKSAATAGHNDYTISINVLVDGKGEHAQRCTAEQARSVRAVFREARRRSGNGTAFANRPRGHGQFREVTGIGTITPCPGAGPLTDLNAGLFDIDHEEDDVLAVVKFRGAQDQFVLVPINDVAQRRKMGIDDTVPFVEATVNLDSLQAQLPPGHKLTRG